MDTLTYEVRDVFVRVLEGATFVDAAIAANWSHRVARDRVIRVARALQEVVGVEGVEDEAEPTLERLHTHRAAYLEALAHFSPERALSRRGHREATPEDLEAVLAAVARRRRSCARDAAMVLVLFATGLKPAEVSVLEVRDYLAPDGTVRTVSNVRAEAAFNLRERPLYFVNARMREAVDAYLTLRRQSAQILGNQDQYRGLDPRSALFLRNDGKPFGTDARASAATVQNLYHRILRASGIPELSTLSARRAVAGRLSRRGCTLDDIAHVLGLETADSARRLLSGGREPLHQAMMEMF